MTNTDTRPATDKQFAFIKSLIESRDTTLIDPRINVARDLAQRGEFSVAAASALIDLLKDTPRLTAAAPASTEDVPEGMHRFGGVFFKVQRAVHGSGNLYAKALVEDPNSSSGWSFEYAPGAIRNLSADTALPLEEAKKFGALYGTCCVCARTLTDENSIEAGIGPVCATRFGTEVAA